MILKLVANDLVLIAESMEEPHQIRIKETRGHGEQRAKFNMVKIKVLVSNRPSASVVH